MILWTRYGNLSSLRFLSVPGKQLQPTVSNKKHQRLEAASHCKQYSGLVIRRHRSLKQPESLGMSGNHIKCADEESLVKQTISSLSTIDQHEPTDKNFGLGERRPIDEEGFRSFLDQMARVRAQHCSSIKDYSFDERRARCVNGITVQAKGNYRGVSYWMFRDQRVNDNWALVYAQKLALQHKCPLYVTFYLMSHYSVAGTRQYDFMLNGLQLVERKCKDLGIQFHLELGYAKDQIDAYCERNKIDLVIADMCPLRDPMSWLEKASAALKKKQIPLYQVDAHNIVPVWVTSEECEFAAYTIRPKINKRLHEFLTEMPALEKHPYRPQQESKRVNWNAAWSHLKIDETVKPVSWAKPGTMNGLRMLYEFITQRLKDYDEIRNTPTRMGTSYLSPYFHFGQLSVQRAILAISETPDRAKCNQSVEKYLEECVVRRELADNLCFYNRNYDNFNGAPDWAKKTINEHRKDKRDHLYTQEEFQFAKTHDKLWNAAQVQMLQEGTMHGYMRMYWAKKIYEWSPSIEEALKICTFLNDKYELDGRDPNGYTGIMWSICGVHDRPFTERPVYGKIRCMTYFGSTRKFDVDLFAKIYKPVVK